MAFDEIVAQNCSMAPGQFRRDLQPVFEGVERILIDILRHNRESGLSHVLNPGSTAAAGRGRPKP